MGQCLVSLRVLDNSYFLRPFSLFSVYYVFLRAASISRLLMYAFQVPTQLFIPLLSYWGGVTLLSCPSLFFLPSGIREVLFLTLATTSQATDMKMRKECDWRHVAVFGHN